MLIHGLSWLIASGWFKAPIEADSMLAEQLGYTLVEFLAKVNHGLYEEFKTD